MNNNCYENQKLRALSRKKWLVNLMGGQCCICGYKKNYSALEFHHINPSEKEFKLDSRRLANTKSDIILKEAEKCMLVCSNCHQEIHHPSLDKETVDKSELIKKEPLLLHKKKQATCPVCGQNFDFVRGKIYCSHECMMKDKNYPDRNEVVKKYEELKSQKKVAEYYGLTRKIIIGILKREK